MNLNNLRRVQLHGGTLASTVGHLAIHTSQRAYGFSRAPSLEESTQFTPETASNPDPQAREFVEQRRDPR